MKAAALLLLAVAAYAVAKRARTPDPLCGRRGYMAGSSSAWPNPVRRG